MKTLLDVKFISHRTGYYKIYVNSQKCLLKLIRKTREWKIDVNISREYSYRLFFIMQTIYT